MAKFVAKAAEEYAIKLSQLASADQREIAGRAPDAVFSGFHLTNPGLGGFEAEETVRVLAERLAALPCLYYTGHCTGETPFRVLAEVLGERVRYMGCGRVFTLPA